VSRDYSSGYFSWIIIPQVSENNIEVISNFFENSWRYSQVEVNTGINETAANFATRTTGLVDTGGKLATRCQRFWQKICRGVNDSGPNIGTISDCLHLKWILRKKNIYMFTQYPRRKIFSICHRCQRHWWWTLSCKQITNFCKKFETALMGYSGAWGKPIHDKKPEVENLVALSI
jgi:hypothetical protein